MLYSTCARADPVVHLFALGDLCRAAVPGLKGPVAESADCSADAHAACCSSCSISTGLYSTCAIADPVIPLFGLGDLYRTAVQGAAVDTVPLELADLASVRACAARLLERQPPSVLINNAGAHHLHRHGQAGLGRRTTGRRKKEVRPWAWSSGKMQSTGIQGGGWVLPTAFRRRAGGRLVSAAN